jgi:guanylate kinase
MGYTMSGQVIIISAPSGAGKTSLVNAVLQRIPSLKVSVSYTTRAPRPGEKEGEAYHFITIDTFCAMRDHSDFIECAEVHGHFYGTSQRWIKERLAMGDDVILEIDWQGAEQVRRLMPEESSSIFILPPSYAVLKERLVSRAQDHPDTIRRRLAAAYEEVSYATTYDYCIINEEFEQAVEDLYCVLRSIRLKTNQVARSRTTLIQSLHSDLRSAHAG